jgi:hypothetical protein
MRTIAGVQVSTATSSMPYGSSDVVEVMGVVTGPAAMSEVSHVDFVQPNGKDFSALLHICLTSILRARLLCSSGDTCWRRPGLWPPSIVGTFASPNVKSFKQPFHFRPNCAEYPLCTLHLLCALFNRRRVSICFAYQSHASVAHVQAPVCIGPLGSGT